MRQKQEADAFALAVGPLDSELPLTWQLYQALQQAVLQRRLPPGLRLPSTRDMAQLLGVSRNTVVNTVGQLVAEGYLETVPKSGTYVARRLPEEMLHVAEKEARLKLLLRYIPTSARVLKLAHSRPVSISAALYSQVRDWHLSASAVAIFPALATGTA